MAAASPVLISETYYTKLYGGKGTATRALIPTPQAFKTFYLDTSSGSGVVSVYDGSAWVDLA